MPLFTRKGDAARTIRFAVMVTPEELRALKSEAARVGVHVSDVVREALWDRLNPEEVAP